MLISENDYYAALGLTAPEEGGKDPEVAEPEEETETEPTEEEERDEEGGKDREVAEPDEEEHTQTPEERHRAADIRRRRELHDAVEGALKAERERHGQEIAEVFRVAGLKDGDGNSIDSMDKLREFAKLESGRQLSRELAEGTLSEDTLKTAIRQVMTEEKPDREPETRPEREGKEAIERELAEIRKYAPEVKTVDDLMNLDRAEEFRSLVMNHRHSFIDAYKIAYADKIAEKAVKDAGARAAQKTADSIRGKAHMTKSTSAGAAESPVPEDIMKQYRMLNPKMSTDEIAKDYNRYLKDTKKKS